MAKFNINGVWIEAATYVEARKLASSGGTNSVSSLSPNPAPITQSKTVAVGTSPSNPVVKPNFVIPKPKPVVTLDASAAEATPALKTNVSLTLYRGDTREPGIIKFYGFQVWAEAMGNVRTAGGLGHYFRQICAQYKTGKTVADWIRVAKNRARPTISTATSEDCGGYDSGYIYKIEFKGLNQFYLDESILPPGPPLKWNHDGLMVYMDKSTLQDSKFVCIDIKLGTGEHVFCTDVPSLNITSYKDGKTKSSPPQSMLAVTPVSKKLW